MLVIFCGNKSVDEALEFCEYYQIDFAQVLLRQATLGNCTFVKHFLLDNPEVRCFEYEDLNLACCALMSGNLELCDWLWSYEVNFVPISLLHSMQCTCYALDENTLVWLLEKVPECQEISNEEAIAVFNLASELGNEHVVELLRDMFEFDTTTLSCAEEAMLQTSENVSDIENIHQTENNVVVIQSIRQTKSILRNKQSSFEKQAMLQDVQPLELWNLFTSKKLADFKIYINCPTSVTYDIFEQNVTKAKQFLSFPKIQHVTLEKHFQSVLCTCDYTEVHEYCYLGYLQQCSLLQNYDAAHAHSTNIDLRLIWKTLFGQYFDIEKVALFKADPFFVGYINANTEITVATKLKLIEFMREFFKPMPLHNVTNTNFIFLHGAHVAMDYHELTQLPEFLMLQNSVHPSYSTWFSTVSEIVKKLQKNCSFHQSETNVSYYVLRVVEQLMEFCDPFGIRQQLQMKTRKHNGVIDIALVHQSDLNQEKLAHGIHVAIEVKSTSVNLNDACCKNQARCTALVIAEHNAKCHLPVLVMLTNFSTWIPFIYHESLPNCKVVELPPIQCFTNDNMMYEQWKSVFHYIYSFLVPDGIPNDEDTFTKLPSNTISLQNQIDATYP